MNWMYANKYGELPSGQAEIVEALVAIAEMLERLNKNIEGAKNKDGKIKVDVSGGINTHTY
jgi:uncharacterized protein (DUF2141 family)